MVTTAWSRLSRPPASIATARPSHGLPVDTTVEKPATAPISIMPSTPRLSTPARSAKISPMVAKRSTVPAATPAERMMMGSMAQPRTRRTTRTR